MSSSPDLWTIRIVCPPDLAEKIEEILGEEALAVSVMAPPRTDTATIEILVDGKPDEAAFKKRLESFASQTKWDPSLRWGDDSFGRPPEQKKAVMPAKAGIPFSSFSIEILPVGNLDWIKKVAGDFPPLSIGRWTIFGAMHKDKIKDFSLALQIDATSAFGTGEHPTTRGCLLLLDELLTQNPDAASWRMLDVGCGSGILGMAFAKAINRETPKLTRRLTSLALRLVRCLPGLSYCSEKAFSVRQASAFTQPLVTPTNHFTGPTILGIDMDEPSVAIANENAEINGISSSVRFLTGMGYAPAEVGSGAPYDLIMANIFADPLCEMAGDLKKHLKPGGFAILSGLLLTQEAAVLAAHEEQGLSLVKRMALGEWSALALRRPSIAS